MTLPRFPRNSVFIFKLLFLCTLSRFRVFLELYWKHRLVCQPHQGFATAASSNNVASCTGLWSALLIYFRLAYSTFMASITSSFWLQKITENFAFFVTKPTHTHYTYTTHTLHIHYTHTTHTLHTLHSNFSPQPISHCLSHLDYNSYKE